MTRRKGNRGAGDGIPAISRLIIGSFLPAYNRGNVLGDLEEEFSLIREESGLKEARAWYRRQACGSVIPGIRHNIFFQSALISNYLRISIRTLARHRAYSIINIAGLAIGLAVFLFFAVLAGEDLHADFFHARGERIFGVVQVLPSLNRGDEHTAFVPAPLLPALEEEFPEIEKASRVLPPGRMIVKIEDEVFYESGILFVDGDFLDIFSFDLLAGSDGNQLREPNTALITPGLSKKYFGDGNPIGRFIGLGSGVSVRITGVIEEPTHYSSISYRMLVSIETAGRLYGDLDDWDSRRYASFVLLPEKDGCSTINDAMPRFIAGHIADGPDSPKEIYLFPFLDFHLGAYEKIESFMAHENPIALCIYFGTGIMVLLVVCINFMNLSTARYMRRAREVGVRKAIGAGRGQLVAQFLGESVVMAAPALPVGVALYYFMFGALLSYLGADIEVPLWNHPYIIRYLIAVTLSTGLLAGIYPAFFLTRFSPVEVLKGRIRTGKRGPLVRRTLVVSQFVMAVVLIVFAVISKRQFDFILEKVDFGYNRERVMIVPVPEDTGMALETLKEELLRDPAITAVAASSGIPTDWDAMLKVVPEGAEDKDVMTIFSYGADHDLLGLLEIGRASGRFIADGSADVNSVVINETAARELGWDQPVGKQLMAGERTFTIVGVASDFTFRNITYGFNPSMIYLDPDGLDHLFVRYSTSAGKSGAEEAVRRTWQRMFPEVPLESSTLADAFTDEYAYLDIFGYVFGLVDLIAVVLSCLGLFGLASYAVERRTKEIGIRKVLGASTAGMVRMLMKELLILVGIANLIAAPAAWFFMDFLFDRGYPHSRVPVGLDIFIFAALITLSASVLAIASRTIRAASANPVRSIRYE